MPDELIVLTESKQHFIMISEMSALVGQQQQLMDRREKEFHSENHFLKLNTIVFLKLPQTKYYRVSCSSKNFTTEIRTIIATYYFTEHV